MAVPIIGTSGYSILNLQLTTDTLTDIFDFGMGQYYMFCTIFWGNQVVSVL